MKTPDLVGFVSELWRFPVKSMAGERLEEAIMTAQGILGDRGYALLNTETDELVSASNRHFPGLLNWRASYLEPPRRDTDLPPVRLTLPDGVSATSDSPSFPGLLSSHFGRSATLVQARPDSHAKKQAGFFTGVGLECAAPTTALVDLCPVSVISLATLTELGLGCPGSSFDLRRFRMNIVVTTRATGFVDNTWVGRRLTLGGHVRLTVIMPDPRCVMTNLPQGDLERDPGILRTIAQRNSLPVGTGGPLPCAGVYASVAQPGVVRRGDAVTLGEP